MLTKVGHAAEQPTATTEKTMEGNSDCGCCGTLRAACVRVQESANQLTRCVDSLAQLRWPGPGQIASQVTPRPGCTAFLTLNHSRKKMKEIVFI